MARKKTLEEDCQVIKTTTKMLELYQVAARLNCSHSHVLNMINRNQIKAKNIGTLNRNCWRIAESELILFMSK